MAKLLCAWAAALLCMSAIKGRCCCMLRKKQTNTQFTCNCFNFDPCWSRICLGGSIKKRVLHLKLLGEATVGVGSLLPVVLLIVLGPHLHTSARTESQSSNKRKVDCAQRLIDRLVIPRFTPLDIAVIIYAPFDVFSTMRCFVVLHTHTLALQNKQRKDGCCFFFFQEFLLKPTDREKPPAPHWMDVDVRRLFAWQPAAWKQRVQSQWTRPLIANQLCSDKPPPEENCQAENE